MCLCKLRILQWTVKLAIIVNQLHQPVRSVREVFTVLSKTMTARNVQKTIQH